jgi:K(+)-stimulated pyrophosphate-energized sodium pump
MDTFLINNGIPVALALGVVAIITAIILVVKVRSAATGTDLMREIAAAVQEGAAAYLSRQIKTISAIALVLLVLIYIFKGGATSIGFLIGAVCSLLAGFIGMRVAVITNIRTAQAATIGAIPPMRIAFNGGAVTGLLVVGLALVASAAFTSGADAYFKDATHKSTLDAIVGLALGASLISVFARLGGGIYTKAADVGADFVGKIEQNLDEDDPRNPATIADNVGDNVGDCAGMAADVFETYAVSLIGSGARRRADLRGGAECAGVHHLSVPALRPVGHRVGARHRLHQRGQLQAGQRVAGRRRAERRRLGGALPAADDVALPER